ncbi:unnamed protein product (macronuclear) [Paramecium tetraurelia]|uniref:Uncharacterized protein n=1 Tax=Paramecium tetraurelia TaxID=5888 RepID=A0CRQ8_PARTE|nr:uncharacterized protein GSPATT00009790001 [Paramecium tetraurelia]CAK73475.1 unnamed protein product [Paramecium tetraurelia]|eukprot:XP_001440872.1 hypothetical protein (macronuclear) [Paramecium tetraurelia strain d4-2]
MDEPSEQEIDELQNQYFQDKMFRVCAKAVINDDAYFNRLYEPEYLQGLADRAKDQKEKNDILNQKKKVEFNQNNVKEMFYQCFNRYFYVYGVLQQVAHAEED